MEQPILALVSIACVAATVVWGRSAQRHQISWSRLESEYGSNSDQAVLARGTFRKELHSAVIYAVLAVALGIVALVGTSESEVLLAFLLVPVIITFVYRSDFRRTARLAEDRTQLERKAQEVL